MAKTQKTPSRRRFSHEQNRQRTKKSQHWLNPSRESLYKTREYERTLRYAILHTRSLSYQEREELLGIVEVMHKTFSGAWTQMEYERLGWLIRHRG